MDREMDQTRWTSAVIGVPSSSELEVGQSQWHGWGGGGGTDNIEVRGGHREEPAVPRLSPPSLASPLCPTSRCLIGGWLFQA